MARELTAKQEKFCQGVAEGLTYADAFRRAYGQGKRATQTLYRDAYRVMESDKVAARIAELKEEQQAARLATRIRKREVLNEILEDSDESAQSRIKAIEVDNLMTGDNKPQKVEVFGLSDLMKLVRSGGEDG